MANLRQAAQNLVDAMRAAGAEWDGLPVGPLEQALVDDEPTTDELLRRLQPHQLAMVRRDSGGCCAVARYQLERDGPPITSFRDDPALALRAVLLQLPAPTEPPPEEHDDDWCPDCGCVCCACTSDADRPS